MSSTFESRHAVLGTAMVLMAAPSLLALAQARDLPRAPAFLASDLTALPRAGWLTNGGNLANQRYSPLTSINRDNVANLRGEWRASLGGSGMGPRTANQAQPIVYDGVSSEIGRGSRQISCFVSTPTNGPRCYRKMGMGKDYLLSG